MKSLYESILSSTGSGKSIIKEWCEKHEIFNGEFVVNTDFTISSSRHALYLHYDDYDDLPNYIKFKDDEDLQIFICPKSGYNVDTVKPIKSFRGLPKKAYSLYMKLPNSMKELPSIDIELKSYFSIENSSSIKKYKHLGVKFYGSSRYDCELTLYSKAELKNLDIKHVCTIKFVDEPAGEAFSKAMTHKAEMNKSREIYETPISEEGLKALEDFFKGTGIETKYLTDIEYSQSSKLHKHEDGKWYRCKNW